MYNIRAVRIGNEKFGFNKLPLSIEEFVHIIMIAAAVNERAPNKRPYIKF